MSRTLSFIITGPPTLDAGSFVAIVDDATGQPIEPGWWQHDGVHWRYYLPYEFAPRLVEPPPAANIAETIKRAEGGSRELGALIDQSDAILMRQRRREQIAGAERKSASAAPTAASAEQTTAPAHWESCPACRAKFDPARHELMDCGNCGEAKCTAACLPNPVSPCIDCQALDGAAEEQGLIAAPPSGALFDGKFRGKEGAVGSDLQDDEENE